MGAVALGKQKWPYKAVKGTFSPLKINKQINKLGEFGSVAALLHLDRQRESQNRVFLRRRRRAMAAGQEPAHRCSLGAQGGNGGIALGCAAVFMQCSSCIYLRWRPQAPSGRNQWLCFGKTPFSKGTTCVCTWMWLKMKCFLFFCMLRMCRITIYVYILKYAAPIFFFSTDTRKSEETQAFFFLFLQDHSTHTCGYSDPVWQREVEYTPHASRRQPR